MRMTDPMLAVRSRAAEALKTALHQVSQIKLRKIDHSSPGPDLKVDMLAHVDVHGRSHTLVCKLTASGRPDYVRMALKEFEGDVHRLDGNSTLVFIAPRMSEEAKAVCGEGKAGFLDLEGNARLELGDVFIVKRTISKRPPRSAWPLSGQEDAELAGVA